MRGLTTVRAGLIAALVGFIVYLPSLANGWSGDDTLIIHTNEFVHGVGPALGAWFETYWRPPFSAAGLYRPLTILSYGIDWSVMGGAPWWFHLTNVGLHAVTTFLAVLVVSAWLRPNGALVAGLIFALHPVHVEAVANIVGRAEMLVAIGVLGSVIAARHYRVAQTTPDRTLWFIATTVMVAFALFAKENGVIALPVLVLDHILHPQKDERVHVPLYVGVITVTIAWAYLWNGIAGLFTGTAGHGGFFGLTTGQRLTTMFPAYLDLLRILAVPVDLSSDYSPRVIPLRLTWSWLATLGFASTLSLVALGFATLRRAPAVSFSIFVLILSYAPVSNVFFPSGVVLSERGLYLGIVAPAVIAAIALDTVIRLGHGRYAIGGLALVVIAFGWVSVNRIPFWSDPLNPILEERAAHPENYRNRYLLSEYLTFAGDSTLALSELLLAGELNPRDPAIPMIASRLAVATGRPDFAAELALRSFSLYPASARVHEAVVAALLAAGQRDSAIAFAHRVSALAPANPVTAGVAVRAMTEGGAADWKRLLAGANRDWLALDPARATVYLDSARAQLPRAVSDTTECRFLERLEPMVRRLHHDAGEQIGRILEVSDQCRPGRRE